MGLIKSRSTTPAMRKNLQAIERTQALEMLDMPSCKARNGHGAIVLVIKDGRDLRVSENKQSQSSDSDLSIPSLAKRTCFPPVASAAWRRSLSMTSSGIA